MLAGALDETYERVGMAAARSGRSLKEIKVVAVSKGFPASLIREAMAWGQRDFGENRVQEAIVKYKEVGDGVVWHFVGRLQRNKVRSLVGPAGFVDLIHSVDRLELAAEISKCSSATVEVLIEVNVSGEPQKAGVAPKDLPRIVEGVCALERVKPVGLMTMAPRGANADQARSCFAELRALSERLSPSWPGLAHLSMGMSQDYEVAVEEGSTMVRIGEAIFGARPPAAGRPAGG